MLIIILTSLSASPSPPLPRSRVLCLYRSLTYKPPLPLYPLFLLSFSLSPTTPLSLSLHITLTLQHVFFSSFYIMVFEITAYVNDSEYVCCESRQKGESMVSWFKEEGGEERERKRMYALHEMRDVCQYDLDRAK